MSRRAWLGATLLFGILLNLYRFKGSYSESKELIVLIIVLCTTIWIFIHLILNQYKGVNKSL
jgi:hypothetical protein